MFCAWPWLLLLHHSLVILDDDEVVQKFAPGLCLRFVVLFVVVETKNLPFNTNCPFFAFDKLNFHLQGKRAVVVSAVEITTGKRGAVNAIDEEIVANIHNFKSHEESIQS